MTATLIAPRQRPGRPGRWRALGISQAAAFMALLDVSIVNVALPSIERGLDASAGTVQWVVSGYALTLGLVLVPAGRLGDSFGRRRMFLIALSAFVVTSALTGMAPSMGLLIAARLLQGAAAGMLIPQNSGLVQELFDGPERGRAFGIIGATVGLATAVGPVAGGLILTAVPGPEDWRWVFYINVPIGLVTMLLARRFLPSAAADQPRRAHLDVVGALLLGAGVLCVLLPLVESGTGDLGGLSWLYGLAVLLFAGFVRWEARTVRRGRQPLLDPQLFRVSGYAPGVVIGLVYFVGFTGIWLVLAMFFQHGLGYSPLRSGLAVTPFAIGTAASAVIAGRLVTRYGRWVTVCGLTAAVIGLVVSALLLGHASGDAAAWIIALPLLVAGAGGGMVTSPNMTLTLEHVPVAMAGAAGGAMQTAQRIGSAIGTAVLATIFYHLIGRAGLGYPAAVRDTLLYAAGFMLLALLLAVADLAAQRRRQRHA
ncbi:MAG TPA: MFS transporter, partial [Actinoplanes sp.]|nr:MFS transporter [Actinoplanes sp.]